MKTKKEKEQERVFTICNILDSFLFDIKNKINTVNCWVEYKNKNIFILNEKSSGFVNRLIIIHNYYNDNRIDDITLEFNIDKKGNSEKTLFFLMNSNTSDFSDNGTIKVIDNKFTVPTISTETTEKIPNFLINNDFRELVKLEIM